MADTNKYISALSGQLYLSHMDMPRKARLEQLKILGTGYKDQIGTMTAPGIYTGGWDPNAALPDPALPPYDITTDADWEKIYISLQKTLRDIKNDKAATKDNSDAAKLLTDFYGAGLLLEEFSVSSALTAIVGTPTNPAFITFLDDPDIRIWLEDSVSSDDQDKLLSALRDGSYVKKPDILSFLQKTSAAIITDAGTTVPPIANPFTDAQFRTIYHNCKEPEPPTAAALTRFKNNYKNIFERLLSKDKALEAFASKDKSDISDAISSGKKKNNYKDGKFALMPMDESSLNLYQKAGNKVNYVKNDMLGKLSMRHKRHPYVMDETAKPIMESLFVGQNFDMTKGLDEFLTKIEKIKGDLGNSPKSIPHLEYVEKVLKDMKKSLPQEFSGALKDSANMQGIVDAIIERGVDDGRIDEAQTVLECLAMMTYGYFSSGTRDKIGKENLVLLGDPGLSWNKNAGVKFVFSALDKTAKGILMLGANAATGLRNAWKKRKTKFKDGSDAVKLMAKANETVATLGPINPALIATLNSNVQAAKLAFETASRAPNSNEKEIKRLEKEWKLSEMILATTQQIDPITGDRKVDNKLTQKQNLMAFWNYVNSPSQSGRDLNIFRNGKRAQNFQNQMMGTGNMRKIDNLKLMQQQFYDNSIAT